MEGAAAERNALGVSQGPGGRGNRASGVEHARGDGSKILGGGTYDDKVGYFIQPTVVEAVDPKSKLMKEEIFGPVLTWYVYDAKDDTLTFSVVPMMHKFLPR